jgi:hypothetical protein
LLRAFPFTRSAGEGLLALALALALVYPFMFLIDYEVHKIMKNHIGDPTSLLKSFVNKSGIFGVALGLLSVMMLMGGIMVPILIGTALSVCFELVKGAVYYIVIMGLLMPVFNIFITLTVARETARFFGVEVNLMSFLKII